MTKLFNSGDEPSRKEEGSEVKTASVQSVDAGVKVDDAEVKTEGGDKWNLSHLDEEKREKLEKVLLKVEDMFSKDDADIGDIQGFKMPINLVAVEC